MAGTITKTIQGRKYTYFEYFDGKKTVQKYCGPEGSRQARIKALRMEYDLLKSRRDECSERMKAINEKIKRLEEQQHII